MAYVITITDGNGKKITVEVSYEIFRFDTNYRRGEKRYTEEAKDNSSYEGFCELNEEFYMKIPEQITTPSCEMEIIKGFSKEELHKAIDQLPEKQRRRIILMFSYGLTTMQIANIENVAHPVIVKSIQRALLNLKKNIGNVEI